MSLLDTASLIVTPNAVKEGKLYSVIPSDGSGDLSVVRATTATRVNSAGLVELVPYNLLTYSQDFTNADWIKDLNNGSFATNATAPDGTTTAQTLTAGSGNFGYCYRFVTNSSGSVYAFSFYAKKGTANFAWMQTTSSSASYVNLTTLAVSAASGVTITATNVGNGWVRIVGVSTASSSSHLFAIGGSNASGSASMTSGTTIEVWGAQLVEGSTAKDYQKTETRLNIPRLDYSNGTCPSLLVEPQRTNVLNYSEDFANATWTKAYGSLTSNAITSPSGTLTADKFIEDTTNVEHYLEQSFTSIASTTYAFSLYAKAAERSRIVIQLLSVSSPFENVYIEANLVSGTLVVQQAYNGATFVGATIEELPNGWYRITGAGSIGAKTNMRMRIYIANDLGQITYLGNGTSGLYVWGAQLELGSYSTSYIPTTSASVTRNADVISKTGISSLIGQTEGVFFLDFYFDGVSSNFVLMQTFQNASQFNVNQLYLNSTKRLAFEVGPDAAILSPNSLAAGRYKIAGAYANNDFVLYLNGDLIGTDTSGSVISTDAITFNDYYALPDTYKQRMEINAAALWKTRLTNTQLAQLTTI